MTFLMMYKGQSTGCVVTRGTGTPELSPKCNGDFMNLLCFTSLCAFWLNDRADRYNRRHNET